MHNAVPKTALYFPARHAEHVPPLGPVNPLLHIQLTRNDDVVRDCEFAGQSLHAAVPSVGLYFPAKQAGHGPLFGPEYPI
jgi:hypothetical protein